MGSQEPQRRGILPHERDASEWGLVKCGGGKSSGVVRCWEGGGGETGLESRLEDSKMSVLSIEVLVMRAKGSCDAAHTDSVGLMVSLSRHERAVQLRCCSLLASAMEGSVSSNDRTE